MRARNIKPGFYGDKRLLKCSLGAHFVFPALWMLADRDGRLKDDPEQIGIDSFLLHRGLEPEPLLKELADNNIITRYTIGHEKYIQINNFSRHQKPHPNEKSFDFPPPKIKLHDKSCNFANDPDDIMNDDIINDKHNTPYRGKKKKLTQTRRREIWFTSLQKKYPIGSNPQKPCNVMRVRVAKRSHGEALGEAKKKNGLPAEKALQTSMIRGIAEYSKHPDTTEGGGKYVLGIGRWFEERTWERFQPPPQTDNPILKSVLTGGKNDDPN